MCRLYLHKSGSLSTEKQVDYAAAQLWKGTVTGIVRTERHPKNRGATGEFASSDFTINISSLAAIPELTIAGGENVDPRTQVVVRFDGQGESGSEVYSLADKSPVVKSFQTGEMNYLDKVDDDIAEYFTNGSVSNKRLIYKPAVALGDGLAIEGYNESMRPNLGSESYSVFSDIGEGGVSYAAREPRHAIQPFFFLSKYAIRSKK